MGKQIQFNKLNVIKGIILLASILGFLMVLFDNIWGFSDKEKDGFLRIIEQNLECSPNEAGAKKFLDDYFYPLFNSKKAKYVEIDKIIFSGTWTKNELLSGGTIREVHSGVIKVRNKNGITTVALANYSELINWAKDNKFMKWLSLTILAISVFFQALIYFLWELKNKKPNKALAADS